MIKRNTIIEQNQRVSYRIYKDEAVIINHDKDEILKLNPVASKIWDITRLKIPFIEIVNNIKDNFEVNGRDFINDIKSFILSGNDYGLFKIKDIKVRGYTDEKNKKFLDSSQKVNIKSLGKSLSIPIHTILEITNNCNQNCKHCYNSKSNEKQSLSKLKIYKLLDDLKELGCLELTVTGGEPLVREDIWDILSYARKNKFSVLLKTNGTLINKEIAKKLYDLCIMEVHISLYSLDPKKHEFITKLKGSLIKTQNSIENLIKMGIKVRISCPVTNLTLDSVHDIKEYSKKCGADCGFDLIITKKVNGNESPLKLRLASNDIIRIFNDPKIYNSIFEDENVFDIADEHLNTDVESEENICGAGSYIIGISPYGDVYPCIAWQLPCGNVLDKNLNEIWYSSEELINIRKLKSKDLGECHLCEYLKECPRCPGVLFHEKGKIDNKMEEMCLIAQNLNEKLL